MPQINRIRVNNVKYNFGTQFYDDFVMRFSCKNTIYDLANGGGKSVLMLLLLQNMLPNCTLDEKQPIEKLFRSGNDNTVIHSLVEWKLNPCHIKNGFQYMTTGFCARKARENGSEAAQDRNTAAVEYFNYCIFYREFNDNDLRNLPLCSGEERITYQGLKNYLRDLEKKDFSLQVQLFERKGEYQSFVADYGIYESEWEIIRGINKTEGHVRTYFETNYRTTRKVVEDLLIGEIIQKAFFARMDRNKEEVSMAQTLLDIRDKLLELSRKKNEIINYDRQIEMIAGFVKWMGTLKHIYHARTDLEDQLVRTYNTCLHREQEKNQARERLQERRESVTARRQELMRKAESASVSLEICGLKELEQKMDQYRKELEGLEEEQREWSVQLTEKESANDYLDYLDAKAHFESTRVAIDSMQSQNQGLAEQLCELAGQMKILMDRDTADLKERLAQVEAQVSEKEEQLQAGLRRERETDRAAAVLENSRILQKEHNRQTQQRIEELYRESHLLLLEKAGEELTKKQGEEQEALRRIRDVAEEIKTLEEQLTKIRISDAQQSSKEESLTSRQEECQGYFRRYRGKKQQLDKIKEIYQIPENGNGQELVREAFQNNLSVCVRKRSEFEAQKEMLSSLRNKQPVTPSEAVLKLKEQIERIHGIETVIGCEYVGGLEEETQKEMLERYPLLPYGLLVKEGYDQVALDQNLKYSQIGDTAIPVLSLTAVEKGQELTNARGISFVTKDESLYYDEERRQQAAAKLEKELEEKERKLLRMETQTQTMEEDLKFLQSFETVSDYEEKQKEFEKLNHELRILRQQGEQNLLQKEQLNSRIRQLNGQRKEEEARRESLAGDVNRLRSLTELQAALEDGENKIYLLEKQAAEKAVELTKLQEQTGKLRKELTHQQQQKEHIGQELDRIQQEWTAVYASYNREGEVSIPTHTRRELEMIFKGKKEAYETESSDTSDKLKLLENYQAVMERAKAAIHYRSVSLEELDARYGEVGMQRSSQEDLLKIRSTVQGVQDRVKELQKQLDKDLGTYHKKQGSVQHARIMIEQQYGTFEDMELPEERLELLVSENRKAAKQLEEDLVRDENSLRELISQCYALEAMQEDMEQMMKTEGINRSENQELLESGISLKETYRDLKKQYAKMKREETLRQEEFLKEKNSLAEILTTLGAYDLAQEIKQSIRSPESAAEVDTQTEKLRQTIRCIELEKDRVGKGIEDMSKIKDNFENQCLQSCMNIKEELERLPKLSKINLDGKPVSILTLQIPYRQEEQFKEAMSRYVDQIAEHADAIESPNERLKYVKNQLAWKKLFAVIVTDMDAIKLNLYKRERMIEQSRYLRYEEAVGSTGQSQGIYIQFLVAVVNYITSIYAGNTDPVELRKVIFIDNPFGAAKDIYIWEPIFQLLKNNHVQLIVPARGATPAITGRFEVNYILGQKFVSGRQQTVVVDYRSQTDESELEYIPITYEQEQLQLT